MRKTLYIAIMGCLFVWTACSKYDSFSDELNLQDAAPSIVFDENTNEPIHISEGKVKEIDIIMPYAIRGEEGVQVQYKFGGDLAYGRNGDFIVKVEQNDNPEGGTGTLVTADETGGSFIIQNNVKVSDGRGNMVYSNIQNRVTMYITTFAVYGVDKPEGKSLSVELVSAVNLDDNSEVVTVGQGSINKTYNIVVDDIHCPSELSGTYTSRILYKDIDEEGEDIVIEKDGDDEFKYHISNIAGNLLGQTGVPFAFFDQCDNFISPADDNFRISGNHEKDESGVTQKLVFQVALPVFSPFLGDVDIKEWRLELTPKTN